MKIKKLLAVLLALCLMAGLAACGGPSDAAVQAVPAETPAPVETPVPATPTPTPTPTPKTTLAIAELAEGVYTGTLSGVSYTEVLNDGAYSISPEISPAEITVTIKDGQVSLSCAADAVAGGTVYGVEAPASPAHKRCVSGTLSLMQSDEATVRAEGDIVSPGDDPWIFWDGNKKFDRWEIKTHDGTYHCSVSIALADGVPMAEIAVDGKISHRTATVPLQLKG